ncbi:hypothetical protein ILUMI_21023 [Ignelater luminosus]|uniref:Uncharacterized protein n=1 Tax=Ignelater luminosus TaxID=2038154 RepID=A0A8K0G1T1_IGNLU|nr:hypothetical protein ILUMI_21023 [Ignelater luminosus]
MPIDPTVFEEEDFLASDYSTLDTENGIVTVMNNSTANPMNQDQTPSEANSLPGKSAQVQNTTVLLSEFTNPLPGSSNILTPSKSIVFPLTLPTATKARKRANTKQHSAILTATPLKADLVNKKRKERKTVKHSQQKKRQLKNIKKPKIALESSSDEEILASKRKKKIYLKSPTSSSSSIGK